MCCTFPVCQPEPTNKWTAAHRWLCHRVRLQMLRHQVRTNRNGDGRKNGIVIEFGMRKLHGSLESIFPKEVSADKSFSYLQENRHNMYTEQDRDG